MYYVLLRLSMSKSVANVTVIASTHTFSDIVNFTFVKVLLILKYILIWGMSVVLDPVLLHYLRYKHGVSYVGRHFREDARLSRANGAVLIE